MVDNQHVGTQIWLYNELLLKWYWCLMLPLYCRTTTKGPKWHSSLEPLPTLPFTYKAWVWMTRQMNLHRHRQMMIIVLFVLYYDWLTFNAGHLYWTFNLSCNRPLCKWYDWNRHKGANVTCVLLSWYGSLTCIQLTPIRGCFLKLRDRIIHHNV